ncbi:MAG: hypothetical protein Q9160_004049 [Pyrenula sp. 1 TL-2023]
MIYEGLDRGTWTGASDSIPVTELGEELGILDVSDEKHPVMKRPISENRPAKPDISPQDTSNTASSGSSTSNSSNSSEGVANLTNTTASQPSDRTEDQLSHNRELEASPALAHPSDALRAMSQPLQGEAPSPLHTAPPPITTIAATATSSFFFFLAASSSTVRSTAHLLPSSPSTPFIPPWRPSPKLP